MKSRENLVRLKKFQVSEQRRQLAQLDLMIGEFERMAAELELQIAAEEKRPASPISITSPIRTSPRRPAAGATM
jgi:hypothetical protein